MKYQSVKDSETTVCDICPRHCSLKKGERGFCYVRKNVGGNIVLETYGYNTGLAIDPIEKKPLYQFLPGTNVLSFGTAGCNMGCKFCQNWLTTKNKIDVANLYKAEPKDIVKIALDYGCKSVAFTYNDPIVFFEYAIDTAKICHKNGLKTVAVTSGFINPEPAKEFFKYIDAVNIDLKGFDKEFYKKYCLADINPVLDTIKYVKQKTNCWLELTTLLIEGVNDSYTDVSKECEWIKENLGKNVPLHFSAFYPAFKMSDKKPTSLNTLLKAYNIALSVGLNYVYTGNIPNTETETTFCKNCKRTLIKRNGYSVKEYNLVGNKCKFCNTVCDGVF